MHDDSTAWDRELRLVHERLRASLALAREAVDGGAAASFERLLTFCKGFCAALDGHHTSEDAALFPALLDRHPELAGTVAKLTQDHSMLAYLLGDFSRALGDGTEPDDLHRHLDGIEAIMETHFGFEERQLLEPLRRLVTAATPRDMFGSLA